MKWVDALEVVIGLITADTELTTALGGVHVYRHGEHSDYQVPGLYYLVIFSELQEAVEPVLTQWDIYAADIETVLTVEERLRKLLHWTGWRTIGDVSLSSVFETARDHPEPAPDVVHRSLDFRHQPVRNRGW